MMNCRACSITFVLYMRYRTVSFLSFGTDWPQQTAEHFVMPPTLKKLMGHIAFGGCMGGWVRACVGRSHFLARLHEVQKSYCSHPFPFPFHFVKVF